MKLQGARHSKRRYASALVLWIFGQPLVNPDITENSLSLSQAGKRLSTFSIRKRRRNVGSEMGLSSLHFLFLTNIYKFLIMATL